MRIKLLVIVLLCGVKSLAAQDLLVLENGNKIECKIHSRIDNIIRCITTNGVEIIVSVDTLSQFLQDGKVYFAKDISNVSVEKKSPPLKTKDKNLWKVSSGLGMGINYGVLGSKTVIGVNGLGVLVGFGWAFGTLGYQFGFQYSHKWCFVNYGYGVLGTSIKYFSSEHILVRPIKGQAVVTGGMINLGQRKKTFIDLGIGNSWGHSIPNIITGSKSSVVAITGLGRRF